MEFEKPTKEYHVVNNTVYSCQYHVVFCPKYRRKVLTEEVGARFKEIVGILQERLHFKAIEMEVMPDHVHLLLDVYPTVGVYRVVNQIKGATSHALTREFPHIRTRVPSLWTRSKFISSVGAVSLETVQRYILDQKREREIYPNKNKKKVPDGRSPQGQTSEDPQRND